MQKTTNYFLSNQQDSPDFYSQKKNVTSYQIDQANIIYKLERKKSVQKLR